MQTFKWDGVEDVSLTFENVRTPSLVIIKKDKDTDIPLKDVPFEVYKDGRLITTVTTNIAGYANVTDLSEGYYEIVEKDAPDGYILDTERHGIYIDPYNPELEDDPVLIQPMQAVLSILMTFRTAGTPLLKPRLQTIISLTQSLTTSRLKTVKLPV